MRTEIRFGMPAQGFGFVGGALNHSTARPVQASSSAAVQVAAERSAAYPSSRMKFDTGSMATKQTPGWNVSSSHTVTCRGAMPSPTCRALRLDIRDQGRFQGRIELVLRAVAHPDQGRKPAQLQKFTHQPGAARNLILKCAAITLRCNQDVPSGVRTNATRPAGHFQAVFRGTTPAGCCVPRPKLPRPKRQPPRVASRRLPTVTRQQRCVRPAPSACAASRPDPSPR
jgi:hypothetical protein